MNPSSSLFFILLLTLWPHQILADDLSYGPDLITNACNHAVYKDLCKASLQSVTKSDQADLHDLAVIALRLASLNGSEIFDYTKKLLDTSLDPFMQQCLTDCSENYQDAIDQLEDSLVALDSKGYKDVNTWVTAAMADAESCEEGFKDQPGHNSPLMGMNTMFSQLCSNALAIANLLAAGI